MTDNSFPYNPMRSLSTSEATHRATRWVILPLVVYVLAAVVITWPLVTQITTHAAGAGYSDSYEVIRHSWWMREALLDGQNPFDQTLLVYPDGFMSWLQWTHPLQYFPPALLSLVFSPLTAFNLWLLIVMVLNGWSAYLLGMHFSRQQPLAALLGGLVFLAFPTVQGHLSVGHLGIVSLYPLPLLALCLWRVLRENAGWRTAIWGGVWLALTALVYVSQVIFVVLPMALVFAFLLRRGEGSWRDQPWLKLLVMAVLGGLLILPFYAPLLTDEGRAEVRALSEGGRVAFSADVLAFASPSPFGPLEDIAPDYSRDVLGINSAEGTAYLGVIAVFLASLALRRREAWPWLIVGLVAMLLSLGPLLKWRDIPVTIPIEEFDSYVTLPWALLQHLPFLDATRTPGRFNLSTGLTLSLLVSMGAGVLFERVRRRAFMIGIAAVLGGLILLEYQLFWPFLTVDARQPEYFTQLADNDDVRAVLDVPANHNLVAKIGLYQQTFHHKPLIAGHALRRTPQNPAILALLDRAALSDGSDGMPPLSPDDVRHLLWAAGADRVIVHKDYLEDVSVVDRLKVALGAPEYEDRRIVVFAVPAESPPPEIVFAAGVEGWSDPVQVGDFKGWFLADSGEWAIYVPDESYGELVFQQAPYATARQIGAWLDDHLISGWWAGAGEYRLRLWLEPGFHRVRFQAVGGCLAYPFELTCLGADSLSGECAPLDPPACISVGFGPPTWVPAETIPTPLDVFLDGGLRLTAYDLGYDCENRTLNLNLFWRADGPLPEDYALFVHVADPITAQPYPGAQYDGFPMILPHDWEPGTRWQSEVQIKLPDDLEVETAAINVGWFRPTDGRRLAVHGDRASAGIISLDSIKIQCGV